MAAKFSDLVEYFENLAGKHISIRHTPASKHFYRFELDEVLTGIASNIKYPALILEGYDFNFSESNSDNILKRRSGAFMIINRVADPKNYDRIHEVWDELESITDDIIVRMKSDKESRLIPVLRDFDISSCEGTIFSVAQLGQHGIRITFNLTSPVDGIVDESKWT